MSSTAMQRKRLEAALTGFLKSFYALSLCLEKESELVKRTATHNHQSEELNPAFRDIYY